MPFKNAKQIVLLGTALGHKRRLRILQILFRNPASRKSFGALQAIKRIPSAPLRHHLKVLETASLISRRRCGSKTSFHLDISVIGPILAPILNSANANQNGLPVIQPRIMAAGHQPTIPSIRDLDSNRKHGFTAPTQAAQSP